MSISRSSAGRRRFSAIVFAGSIAAASATALPAVNHASQTISYSAGGDASVGFRTPDAALNLPNPIADPVFGNSVLTPFNPPYLSSDLVIIGDGGQLTLKFAQPITPDSARREIGVFANNGLQDTDYPHGQVSSPAAVFSDIPQAIVAVSPDNITWTTLTADQQNPVPIAFANPTNFYADLGADPSFNTSGGSQVADFSKEFTGQLSDFGGLSWSGVKTLLNGSGGGTWLDISGYGLSEVNYIRFSVPSGANYRMVVDAVSAVPEPTSVAMGVFVIAGLLLQRRARA